MVRAVPARSRRAADIDRLYDTVQQQHAHIANAGGVELFVDGGMAQI